MIYLDSSAVLKLIFEEAESGALEAWLTEHARVPVVSSELAKLEVLRACRRMDAQVLPAARGLLAGMDLIPLTTQVIEHAVEAGEPGLRSLDAIHLASALSIRGDLSAVVAYDRRLVRAAGGAGLPVIVVGDAEP